ncbi:hypothetical protein LAUMK7_00986 [Mycobacterium kansasii]|nr:hypothetical protein LAUMK22_00367 [Mycobacterium kansasii]VAZ71790.1 hypothetical protein LAUMK7_00986 [Mycobacterium kansasii]
MEGGGCGGTAVAAGAARAAGRASVGSVTAAAAARQTRDRQPGATASIRHDSGVAAGPASAAVGPGTAVASVTGDGFVQNRSGGLGQDEFRVTAGPARTAADTSSARTANLARAAVREVIGSRRIVAALPGGGGAGIGRAEAVGAAESGAAAPAGSAVSEEVGAAAIAAGSADPAGAAGATVAQQPAPGAAVSAARPDAAGPADPATADESGVAAGTAGLSGRAGGAVAAVAEQQAARFTGLPGAWRPVEAVADHWASQQCPRGCVEHVEQLLGGVGGLGAGIGTHAGLQGAHEVVVKGARLGA